MSLIAYLDYLQGSSISIRQMPYLYIQRFMSDVYVFTGFQWDYIIILRSISIILKMKCNILAFLLLTITFCQISPSAKASPAGSIYIPPYTATNNAWNALQSLGKSCCDNCKKICGFAIKVSGTSYYLTDMGTYLQFQIASNLNQNTQMFTLGQNVDCTWSISINGRYLSQMNYVFMNNRVGLNPSIGNYERWYIEASGSDVYIQNAYQQRIYWYTNLPQSPGLNWTPDGTKLKMEFYPCDKSFGWNW